MLALLERLEFPTVLIQAASHKQTMYSVKSQVSKQAFWSVGSPLGGLIWLALGVLVSFLVINQSPVECQEQVLTVESRQQKDNDELTDTIKYLENIDKYFSQIARPRFGRSGFKQPRFEMQIEEPIRSPLTLRLLKDRLSHSYDKSMAL